MECHRLGLFVCRELFNMHATRRQPCDEGHVDAWIDVDGCSGRERTGPRQPNVRMSALRAGRAWTHGAAWPPGPRRVRGTRRRSGSTRLHRACWPPRNTGMCGPCGLPWQSRLRGPPGRSRSTRLHGAYRLSRLSRFPGTAGPFRYPRTYRHSGPSRRSVHSMLAVLLRLSTLALLCTFTSHFLQLRGPGPYRPYLPTFRFFRCELPRR
jgi:hypothetical protein